MDPQELTDAFAKAGIDTVEKIDFLAKNLSLTTQLRRKELELDGLAAKQVEALKPIQDARIALTNERAAIIDEINALTPPK